MSNVVNKSFTPKQVRCLTGLKPSFRKRFPLSTRRQADGAQGLATDEAYQRRVEYERLAAEQAEVQRVEAQRLAATYAEARRIKAERLAAEAAALILFDWEDALFPTTEFVLEEREHGTQAVSDTFDRTFGHFMTAVITILTRDSQVFERFLRTLLVRLISNSYRS